MIFEFNPENLRDIAAAVSAALKREPSATVLGEVEVVVHRALRSRDYTIELSPQQAQALRNALMRRAWDQRNTSEAFDYSDLADRIGRALDDHAVPLEDQ